MIHVIFLLACYGICFGMMNKVTFLYNRSAYLDALFTCSYCCGFWSGLIAAALLFPVEWAPLIAHALAGAVFCYIADTAMQKLEEYGA